MNGWSALSQCPLFTVVLACTLATTGLRAESCVTTSERQKVMAALRWRQYWQMPLDAVSQPQPRKICARAIGFGGEWVVFVADRSAEIVFNLDPTGRAGRLRSIGSLPQLRDKKLTNELAEKYYKEVRATPCVDSGVTAGGTTDGVSRPSGRVIPLARLERCAPDGKTRAVCVFCLDAEVMSRLPEPPPPDERAVDAFRSATIASLREYGVVRGLLRIPRFSEDDFVVFVQFDSETADSSGVVSMVRDGHTWIAERLIQDRKDNGLADLRARIRQRELTTFRFEP